MKHHIQKLNFFVTILEQSIQDSVQILDYFVKNQERLFKITLLSILNQLQWLHYVDKLHILYKKKLKQVDIDHLVYLF